MAIKDTEIRDILKSWDTSKTGEFGNSGEFEKTFLNVLKQFTGGKNLEVSEMKSDIAIGDLFKEIMYGAKNLNLTVDELEENLKQATDIFSERLQGLLPDDLLKKMNESWKGIASVIANVKRQAQGAGVNTPAGQKYEQMAAYMASPTYAAMNPQQRADMTRIMYSHAGSDKVSPEEAQASIKKMSEVITQLGLMRETSSRRFLTTGQYGELNEEIKSAKAGSAISRQLERTITMGMGEGIKGMRRADELSKSGFLSNMFVGLSAKEMGIDRGESKLAVMRGMEASRDQITRSNLAIAEAKAKIAEIKKTVSDPDARRTALEPYEKTVKDEEAKRKDLSTMLQKSAEELVRPIKEGLAEAGKGFKNAMGSIIGLIGLIGTQLSQQLRGMANATLNPVVGDLIDSLKYGIDMGIKAGQLVYNMTKSTLEGMSGLANAALSFLGTGGLGNVLGKIKGLFRPLGSVAAGAEAAAGAGAGGWFGPLGAFVGSKISSAINAPARRKDVLRRRQLGIEGRRALSEASSNAERGIGIGGRFAKFLGRAGAGGFLGAGISGIASGGAEYIESGNVGKSFAVGGGSAIGSLLGGALLSFAGPVGTVIGSVVGGFIGEKLGRWTYDMFHQDEAKAKRQEDYAAKKRAEIEGSSSESKGGMFGLDPSKITSGNVFSSLKEAILGKDENSGAAKALRGYGFTLTAGALVGTVAGKTPLGGLANNLTAALAAGPAAAGFGSAMFVLDMFTKSLQRGAEQLQKFANINNSVNLSLNQQFRAIGGGKDNKLNTEADTAQFLMNFMQNRGLGKLGFTREDVGNLFAAGSKSSLMGLDSLSKATESAMIISRQLGVDAKELMQSFSEADKIFGVGKGMEGFRQMLYGASPTGQQGQLTGVSLAVTQSLLSAARQMQMTGPQTLSSGANYAGFLGGFYKSIVGLGSDFGNLVKQTPEALTQIAQSVNSFFKGGITGQNPVALSIAASSGMSMRELREGGVTQSPRTFQAAMNSLQSLLPPSLFENGRLTQSAMNTQLPIFLEGLGLEGSSAAWADIFELSQKGDIAGAQKKFEELKGEDPQINALKELQVINKDGFADLLNQEELGAQQNLHKMENNITLLEDISRTANAISGDVLDLGKIIISPLLQQMINNLKELVNLNGGASGSGSAATQFMNRLGIGNPAKGFAGGADFADTWGKLGITSSAQLTPEKMRQITAGQFSIMSAADFSDIEARKDSLGIHKGLEAGTSLLTNYGFSSDIAGDVIRDSKGGFSATKKAFLQLNSAQEFRKQLANIKAGKSKTFSKGEASAIASLLGIPAGARQESFIKALSSNEMVSGTGLTFAEWAFTGKELSQDKAVQVAAIADIQSKNNYGASPGQLAGLAALFNLQDEAKGNKTYLQNLTTEGGINAAVYGGGLDESNQLLTALNSGQYMFLVGNTQPITREMFDQYVETVSGQLAKYPK